MTFGLHPLTGNVSETGTGHGDNCGLSVRSLGGVHCGRITHKVPCRRTPALEKPFSELIGSSWRFCFQSPRFSCRNSDQRKPEHPRVTRSTVHGLRKEFPHKNMATV